MTDNSHATITGDEIVYHGQTTVTFTDDKSVALDTIINNQEPLVVRAPSAEQVTADIVKTALKQTYGTALDTAKINISALSAANIVTITSNDETFYTGEVKVHCTIDSSVELNTIITAGLNKVTPVSEGDTTITAQAVKNSLQQQYANLDINAIAVTIASNNNRQATITSSNNAIYYCETPIVLDNLVLDFTKVLTVTDLGKFVIPGKEQPTNDDITKQILELNHNLTGDDFAVSAISDHDAKITGQGRFSSDTIAVTFTCDKAQALANVISNRNLGTINSNGKLTVSTDLVSAALGQANKDIDVNHLTITVNDDNNSATISGDNLVYRGEVIVNFTIDSSNITNNDFKLQHKEVNAWSNRKDTTWKSNDMMLLANWTEYAPTWDEFVAKFAHISFGEGSFFSVYANGYTNQKLTGEKLTLKTNDISDNRGQNFFPLEYHKAVPWYDITSAGLDLTGYVHIWHDNDNIYLSCDWSIATTRCFVDRIFEINLTGINFN